MTITVEAGLLNRAMRLAAQVVERRNTIPILGNVLIEAGEDVLTVTATDLDVQLRQDMPAACKDGFAVTLPAQKLAAIVGVVKSDARLTITLDANRRAVIKSGRGRWTVATLPRDDFPIIPADGASANLTVPGKELAAMIERVLPFRSTELTRHYLNGPLWHGEAGKLALAATNGHQLMRVMTGQDWAEDAPEVILAPKAAKVIAMLAAEADSAQLGWNERRITATIGRAVLVAKVIDGTFPDYRRVIPGRVEQPATLDPEQLRGALTRMLVAGDRPDSAVLIDPAASGLALTMNDSDKLTEAVEELACEPGEQSATAFNARYLQGLLEALGGDTVELHQVNEGARAMFVRTVEDGAVGVVMPMRR